MSLYDQQTWAGTAGGTANAISLTIRDVSTAADLLGVPLRFKVATTNTGAATITVAGVIAPTAVLVQYATGPAALVGGELTAGNLAEVLYDGTVFVMTTDFFSFPSATHAGVTFVTSGTWTVPAGIYQIHAQLWGGGGGGGGCTANNAGAGGFAGGYSEGYLHVTPGQVITVTVGAKGTGGAAGNNAGTTGGTTTLLTLSATGGTGGAGNQPGGGYASGTPGVGSGGIFAITGGLALNGYFISPNPFGGVGGSAAYTNASTFAVLGAVGYSAQGIGNGGGGAASSTGSAFAGGNGSSGQVIIQY